MEKKLRSKKTGLNGQNLIRHRAVLALLMTTQSRREAETREELSYQISRSFGKRVYFLHGNLWSGKVLGCEAERFRKAHEGVMLKHLYGSAMEEFKWVFENGLQVVESVSFF